MPANTPAFSGLLFVANKLKDVRGILVAFQKLQFADFSLKKFRPT